MKNIFISTIILLVIINLGSCGSTPSHTPDIIKYDSITNNINNLKGIELFKIGETTIQDVRKISKIQKNNGMFYGGEEGFNCGLAYLKLNDDIQKFLPNDKRVNQIYFHKYKIDDIIIENISLLFLDNRLIGIYIDRPVEPILKSFRLKYGLGVGYYKNNSKSSGDITHFNESSIIVWENENVKATYNLMVTGSLGSKKRKDNTFRHNEYLLIEDQNDNIKYIKQLLSDYKKESIKQIEENNMKSINKI